MQNKTGEMEEVFDELLRDKIEEMDRQRQKTQEIRERQGLEEDKQAVHLKTGNQAQLVQGEADKVQISETLKEHVEICQDEEIEELNKQGKAEDHDAKKIQIVPNPIKPSALEEESLSLFGPYTNAIIRATLIKRGERKITTKIQSYILAQQFQVLGFPLPKFQIQTTITLAQIRQFLERLASDDKAKRQRSRSRDKDRRKTQSLDCDYETIFKKVVNIVNRVGLRITDTGEIIIRHD